ncbi:unnamed protein product, partial [Iphiclides podalirius]
MVKLFARKPSALALKMSRVRRLLWGEIWIPSTGAFRVAKNAAVVPLLYGNVISKSSVDDPDTTELTYMFPD